MRAGIIDPYVYLQKAICPTAGSTIYFKQVNVVSIPTAKYNCQALAVQPAFSGS